MDSALRAAIEEHPVVDISTHGRKSGANRRIEIRLWHADGRIFLSGRPGKRSWYATTSGEPSIHASSSFGDAMRDSTSRRSPVSVIGRAVISTSPSAPLFTCRVG